MDAKQAWDELHKRPRFRPKYPEDRIVAWVFRNFPRSQMPAPAILDLGCGAGRHAIFLAREGYRASACDFSGMGVEETRRRAAEEQLSVATAVCEADDLSYPDNCFDGVLVYGTFTYLPHDRFLRAVDEVRRVLKPGGKTIIMTRSINDSRVRHADKVGDRTYRIPQTGAGSDSSEPEAGMTMTFVDEADIHAAFGRFTKLQIDRRTMSLEGGKHVDDDWFIHAEK